MSRHLQELKHICICTERTYAFETVHFEVFECINIIVQRKLDESIKNNTLETLVINANGIQLLMNTK